MSGLSKTKFRTFADPRTNAGWQLSVARSIILVVASRFTWLTKSAH